MLSHCEPEGQLIKWSSSGPMDHWQPMFQSTNLRLGKPLDIVREENQLIPWGPQRTATIPDWFHEDLITLVLPLFFYFNTTTRIISSQLLVSVLFLRRISAVKVDTNTLSFEQWGWVMDISINLHWMVFLWLGTNKRRLIQLIFSPGKSGNANVYPQKDLTLPSLSLISFSLLWQRE